MALEEEVKRETFPFECMQIFTYLVMRSHIKSVVLISSTVYVWGVTITIKNGSNHNNMMGKHKCDLTSTVKAL